MKKERAQSRVEKAWAIKDCKWGTIRDVSLSKAELIKDKLCPECKIIPVTVLVTENSPTKRRKAR